MLNLQKSDNDLNIIVNGRKIEHSLKDLGKQSNVEYAIALKNMNTNFLQKHDKSGKQLTAD